MITVITTGKVSGWRQNNLDLLGLKNLRFISVVNRVSIMSTAENVEVLIVI